MRRRRCIESMEMVFVLEVVCRANEIIFRGVISFFIPAMEGNFLFFYDLNASTSMFDVVRSTSPLL